MKMRLATALLLLLTCSVPVSSLFAQATLLRVDYPDSYTVTEGDTLWTIASQFLQDPERWQEVWRPDPYLDQADFLFPGDVVQLNFVGGNPRIAVTRGDRRVQRLTPMMREETLRSAIPAIAYESIESSITRNRIVSQQTYDSVPYIVENLGDNLAIATGDEVYARGRWPQGTGTFEVYRAGRTYRDQFGSARSNEVQDSQTPWWQFAGFRGAASAVVSENLGLEMEYMGFATVIADEGNDLRRMIINNSYKEIMVGDRLLIRQQERIEPVIMPTEPEFEVDGRIIAFLNGEALASQLDTAVVNLGRDDGIEVGNVLAVRKESLSLEDDVGRERLSFVARMFSIVGGNRVELPGGEIGTLLIYRTFDDLSYALILNSLEPININAEVVNP